MKPIVLDSPVVIGFCDPDDAVHTSARLALAGCLTAGHPLVVPVSVLSEVLVGAFRSTPHAVRTVEGFLDDLVSEVRPLDRAAGRAAAATASTTRSSGWLPRWCSAPPSRSRRSRS